jgi:hypothetical protein
MSIPGFTAEATLYRASGNYRVIVGRSEVGRGHTIVPQEIFKRCERRKYCIEPIQFCQDVCFRYDDSIYMSGYEACGFCWTILPGVDLGIGTDWWPF